MDFNNIHELKTTSLKAKIPDLCINASQSYRSLMHLLHFTHTIIQIGIMRYPGKSGMVICESANEVFQTCVDRAILYCFPKFTAFNSITDDKILDVCGKVKPVIIFMNNRFTRRLSQG
jgi:hypothetical protein